MTARGQRIEILGGRPASPEEVAALAAALELLLAEPDAGASPRPSRWRWSGRRWRTDEADWRDVAGAAHPSHP